MLKYIANLYLSILSTVSSYLAKQYILCIIHIWINFTILSTSTSLCVCPPLASEVPDADLGRCPTEAKPPSNLMGPTDLVGPNQDGLGPTHPVSVLNF